MHREGRLLLAAARSPGAAAPPVGGERATVSVTNRRRGKHRGWVGGAHVAARDEMSPAALGLADIRQLDHDADHAGHDGAAVGAVACARDSRL